MENILYERNNLLKGSQWKYGFHVKVITFKNGLTKRNINESSEKAIQMFITLFQDNNIGTKQLII